MASGGPAEWGLLEWVNHLDLRRTRVFLTARARQGGRRVAGSFWPIVQSSVGASLAWVIAHDVLGHEAPVFAPIAAWICLGFTRDRVPRKVAELGAGATVGVFVGELFSNYLELGWWQVIVVLVTAAVFGRFLDRGELFTMQSGVNGLVIVGMPWVAAHTGGISGRWLDALTGAAVAFLFAVLLPRRPMARPRRYARTTYSELATALDMLADGLRTSNVERLRDVAGQMRNVRQVTTDWSATLTTARDVVGLNPTLWADRPVIEELDRLFLLARRAVATTEMLARQSLGMMEEVGRLPALADLVGDCAAAVHSLAAAIGNWTPPMRAREILTDVALRASPADLDSVDWRPTALMSLVRALVVDLLQGTGLSRASAREALADTWGIPHAQEGDTAVPPEDFASGVWGDWT